MLAAPLIDIVRLQVIGGSGVTVTADPLDF